MRTKQKQTITQLGEWLLSYVEENGITIAELSRRAGLSHSALHSLIVNQNRYPSLETCLRIASATCTPVEKIVEVAHMTAPKNAAEFHPNRLELLRIYDAMPSDIQTALVSIARSISVAVQATQQ